MSYSRHLLCVEEAGLSPLCRAYGAVTMPIYPKASVS